MTERGSFISARRVECTREGFPNLMPQEFYVFFRNTHPNPSLD